MMKKTRKMGSENDVMLFLQTLNLEKWSQQIKSNKITFGNIHDASDVMFMSLKQSGGGQSMTFSEARSIVAGLCEISMNGAIPEIVDDKSLNVGRVKCWTIGNVESYFRTRTQKRDDSIAKCVVDNGINGLVLMSLDDVDISKLGLVAGDQITLKQEIKSLRDLLVFGGSSSGLPQPKSEPTRVVPIAAPTALLGIMGVGVGVEHPSKMKFDKEVPKGFKCPITQTIMADPVTARDGHSYERQSIESWLQNHSTSPVTGAPMAHDLVQNVAFKAVIQDWIEEHKI
jgi:hypothetical protein